MIDYDLHIHTNSSDGVLKPEEIFKIASDIGLRGIAITDHDTVGAISLCEELSDKYNIDFIPGIELSSEYNESEIHLLGYYLDYRNPELLKLLNNFQVERLSRINKMIDKACGLGYKVTIEEIIGNQSDGDEAGIYINSIGRPHLARALINKGYFKNMNDAFDKFLGNGKPGYVERLKFQAEEGIKTIRRFGGIPVLAHPGLIKLSSSKLEILIQEFIDYGLMGIEVYHTDHTMETSYMLAKIANKYNLLITGGSDYHAPSTNRELSIGSKGVMNADIQKLKEAAKLINK
jgi:3',5'-nucleoside bisphosphate phosphatase